MAKSVKIVESAVDVLEQIARSKEDAGVTELSIALDLPKSAIHRILVALSNKGLVTQNKHTQRYSLGLEFLKIAGLAITQMDIVTIVRPYLESLRDQFNETAALALRTGWMYTYIAICPSLQEHAVIPLLGSQSPLHTSAFGKSILAFLWDVEIEQFLDSGLLLRITDKTVTDPDQLKQELDKIRKEDFAMTVGERLPGSIGFASPIFDRSGCAIACIGIVGPDTRITSLNYQEVETRLINAAKEISSVLQISHEYGVI
jgi:DNA-binding IclR family transcriptional regulator